MIDTTTVANPPSTNHDSFTHRQRPGAFRPGPVPGNPNPCSIPASLLGTSALPCPALHLAAPSRKTPPRPRINLSFVSPSPETKPTDWRRAIRVPAGALPWRSTDQRPGVACKALYEAQGCSQSSGWLPRTGPQRGPDWHRRLGLCFPGLPKRKCMAPWYLVRRYFMQVRIRALRRYRSLSA